MPANHVTTKPTGTITGSSTATSSPERTPSSLRFWTNRGLTLSPTQGTQLEYNEWRQLGTELGVLGNSSQWALGDWLHYGTWKYGGKYEEAIAATGYEYQTLANYKSVAEHFDFYRRRENLSFSHHALVAKLDMHEQDDWLDMATANKWTYKQLQERLANERQPTAPSDPRVVQITYRVKTSPEQDQELQDASARTGVPVPDLIVQLALERLAELKAAA